MSTQFHCSALYTIGCKLEQMLANGDGTSEADFANDGRGNQVAADHVRHAVDELRDITGDAAINDALHDRAGACGRFFGRLCDD